MSVVRRVIGPYELVRELGAGRSGVVWEAIRPGPRGLQERVALKLLRHVGRLPDRAGRRELLVAARFGMRMAHPNVVETLDYGESDGTWFLATELVDGVPASGLGTLPAAALIELGCQVCAALEHVHALRTPDAPDGLVHCDVTPGNLLVDGEGLVKLADLGAAQLTGARKGPSGTPGYMAPEQAAGRPEPRSDLFGLGAVLVSLATGALPFQAGPLSVAGVEQSLADPAWVARIDARVPGLGAIAGQCLRGRPGARFPNAAAVATALRGLGRTLGPGPALAELVARARDGAARAPQEAPEAPSDPLFGRTADLGAVVSGLARGDRVWVLRGPGGIGKTRLAQQVVRAGAHGDTCWFELPRVTPAGVEEGRARLRAAIAHALGVDAEATSAAQIGLALRTRGRMLAVLDGVDALAPAAEVELPRWLEAAGQVQWLVTSRVPLAVDGARTHALGPLELADAVALLRSRAGTALTHMTASALADRLDGQPLALHLAAAQVSEVGAARVLEQLGGRRRHAGLQASLEASWELLPERERVALSQLSVFSGGFKSAMAAAVLQGSSSSHPTEAWDAVAALLERVLLRYDPPSGRFTMPASVQAYAGARLEGDARARAELAHARVLAELGSPGALAALRGHGAAAQRRRLVEERENLLVAARRALAHGEDELAVSAALAAAAACRVDGPYAEGGALLDAVAAACSSERMAELWIARSELRRDPTREREDLERAEASAVAVGRPEVQARAALALAGRARQDGRLLDSRACAARADELLQRAEHPFLRAELLSWQATALAAEGSHAEAFRRSEAALCLFRQQGDRIGVARSLGHAGLVAAFEGDTDGAASLLSRSAELYAQEGDQTGRAYALGNLAWAYHRAERWADVVAAVERALEIDERTGHLQGVVHGLHTLARALVGLGETDRALASAERGSELARQVGDHVALLELSTLRAEVLGRLHRTGDAIEVLRSALELAEGTVHHDLAVGCAQATLGECLLAGDPHGARLQLLSASARLRGNRTGASVWAHVRAVLGVACARTERRREGWVAVEDAEAWLREHPDLPLPDARAWLTRARSELDALGAGSPEDAP